MGKKKKISRIVDAVSFLFADAPKKKKLRKAKAFDAFLEQLYARKAELEAERAGLKKGDKRRAAIDADLLVLEEQIGKAERLADKLRSGG